MEQNKMRHYTFRCYTNGGFQLYTATAKDLRQAISLTRSALGDICAISLESRTNAN